MELSLVSSLTKMLEDDVERVNLKAYRFVAYSAATFAVISVLIVCISMPMVYNYMKHVRQQMHEELNYCTVSPSLHAFFRTILNLNKRRIYKSNRMESKSE